MNETNIEIVVDVKQTATLAKSVAAELSTSPTTKEEDEEKLEDLLDESA